MTVLKSSLQERLEQQLKDQLAGKTKTPEVEPEVVVAKVEVDTTGKVEFASITGKRHSKGEYWFTPYQVSDWETDLQPLIPSINPLFTEFDEDYALAILMCIEFDKPMLAYGPPGTGKSVTPEQICAHLNYPYMFIQGMGGTEPADYVGSPWVEEGSMSWKNGPLSYAVEKGVFLLYDEPFKSSAQTNMCIQSLLDSRRELKLYGHPDPVKGSMKAHKKFRIALADNVRGTGDNMHRYAAEVQDQSTLNRCSLKVKVDYPSMDVEQTILASVAPSLSPSTIAKVVSAASKIRSGWKRGVIEMPFSIRDTMEWCKQIEFLGDVKLALAFSYLNAIDSDSQEGEAELKAIEDILQVVGV